MAFSLIKNPTDKIWSSKKHTPNPNDYCTCSHIPLTIKKFGEFFAVSVKIT